MTSRSGSLLEKNVAKILALSGFKPKMNQIINGYEIDVFFEYCGQKIAIECKQYERSTLAVRNLIHQWDSKNKELNFDKIVLVLVGCEISFKDRDLAKKYGVILLDEAKIGELLDAAIEKKEANKDAILKAFEIKTKENEPTIKKDWKPDTNKILQVVFGISFIEDNKLSLSAFLTSFKNDVNCLRGSHQYILIDCVTQEALIHNIKENNKVNNNEDPIDTICIALTILTADFLQQLKSCGIKCIVCKDIAKKSLKGGLFSTQYVPEIDKTKESVFIYTVDELKKTAMEKRKKYYEGTPLTK